MAEINKILEERKTTHGTFRIHAGIAQSLKETMRQAPNWGMLSPSQKEALDMTTHKIARVLCGAKDHLDHWDDMIGYLTLVKKELGLDEMVDELQP